MQSFIDFSFILPWVYYGIGLLVFMGIGWIIGAAQFKDLGDRRLKSSRDLQRGVLKGTISEQLAPYLPGFPEDLKASEARFLGKPVDFIVFKGLDEGNISEVVFVEVKSGRHYYNANETSLKMAIDQKRVRYVPYQVPQETVTQQQ